MRILGELIVILGLALGISLYLGKKVLRPILHKRRLATLERENAELDEANRRITTGSGGQRWGG